MNLISIIEKKYSVQVCYFFFFEKIEKIGMFLFFQELFNQ